MSVVVFSKGILAADSLVMQGGRRFGLMDKIVRTQGCAGGAVGIAADIQRFLNWVLTDPYHPSTAPDLRESKGFGAIFLRGGRIWTFDSTGHFEVHHTDLAIGCGADAARAALCMDARATGAVSVAGFVRPGDCGGAIREIDVHDLLDPPVENAA